MKSRFVYFIPSLLMAALAIALALFGLMKYDAAEEAQKALSTGSESGTTAPEAEQAPVYRYVVAVQPIEGSAHKLVDCRMASLPMVSSPT